MNSFFILLILNIIFGVFAAPPETVDSLDIQKYLGRWYQIADYRQFYEILCPFCTTATYSLNEDGSIAVFNSAINYIGNSLTCKIKGKATSEGDVGQYKLQFDFLNIGKFFGNGQYWILALGPENDDGLYSWAVVSDSGRETLYILSRTNSLDSATLGDIYDIIEEEGFSLDKLKDTKQTGCKYPSDDLIILE